MELELNTFVRIHSFTWINDILKYKISLSLRFYNYMYAHTYHRLWKHYAQNNTIFLIDYKWDEDTLDNEMNSDCKYES